METSVWLRIGCILALLGHHYHTHEHDLEGFDRLFQASDTLNPHSHEFWEVVIFLSLFFI
jgi:hypothetical protein